MRFKGYFMRRNVLSKVQAWKKKESKKPLLLRGARQVGKTWIVREFGKSYESFIEINLEEKSELISIFDQYYGNPEKLIEQLSLILGVRIIPKKSLLFIDEIQDCPNALMALRYFYEKYSDLDVIAAGSLLEFTMKEISFPVGRIEFIYIFPLNFFEYLEAMDNLELVNFLKEQRSLSKTSVSDVLHEKLIDEIKNYCFIGGMPEVVKTFAATKNYSVCHEIQGDLINNFRFDFNKYASRSKVPHLRLLFDSIPKQFSRKFVYASIVDDIKSRELSQALCLLCDAGLAYMCHHTSGNGVPLSAEINLKKFKAYFVDIGLALKSLGYSPKDLPTTKLSDLVNQGGIMEQFVCQELISQTEKGSLPTVFYWQREALNASAEVDFLISRGRSVVPIEVKSGKHRVSKSLGIFINEKGINGAYYISSDKSDFINLTKEIINLSFYDIHRIFEK
jgi:predicted AAA+ superfamily ATPase